MQVQKIIVLKQFYQKAHDNSQSEKAYNAICEEIEHLKERGEDGKSLFSYLKNQNGKKLKGHEHQFKYRMNKGDRIFFTYGKYIPNTPPKYKEAIFIYAYSKHDDQDKQKLPEYTHEIEAVTDEDNLSLDIDEKVYFEDFDFDYINQNSFFVLDESNMPQNLSDSDVYLSQEQSEKIKEYSQNPEPTLLLGGAGTGKTVMELHLLHDYKSSNPEKKCIYFTQSDALLNKAGEKYKHIVSEVGESITSNVEFKNINDFCREYIFQKTKKSISLDNYINDLEDYLENCNDKLQHKIAKAGINNYDLWAEIRGTIKGGLDKDWHRYPDFKMYDFKGDFVQKLEKRELIERTGANKQTFKIKEPKSFGQHKLDFTKYSADFDKILATLNNVDTSVHLQTKENYLQVSGENSTLQEEQRELIYEVAEDYQSWLVQKEKYDDNDLVLKTLESGIEDNDKYDFVVIDEIQDYTELQIYVICQFAKSKNCIIMAGDEHQIINPTIFDESRLRKLFYDAKNQKTMLSIKNLTKNFRCPKEIVEIANKSTELCKKTIASKGETQEEARFNSSKPFFIDYEVNSFNKMLESLLQKPNTVLLVANEAERQSIINNFGKEKYNLYNFPLISTVSEIKGMEYKYVVCYNLISDFAERWKEILGGQAKKQTRYRYYFNLFYVGITRSLQYLCVIEKERNQFFDTFEKDNNSDFDHINSTDEAILLINQLGADSSDWLSMAKKEFDNGNYEKAKTLLKNVSDDNEDRAELEAKCNIYIWVNNKEYEKAAKLAFILNDDVVWNRIKNEEKVPKAIKILKQAIDEPSSINKDLLKDYGSLSKLICSIYDESESNYREKIFNMLMSKMGDYLLGASDSVKMKLEEINV